jgi:2-beta-glucuronyltransferase
MHLGPSGDSESATRSVEDRDRPTAVIFSQHILGLGTRKTSTVFFAEALARRGWSVRFVTVQLSRLSYLVKNPRLKEVPPGDVNKWRSRGDNLYNYVWVPFLHPATFPTPLLNKATSFFTDIYPMLLPTAVKKEVADARLVIIESCAALALFRRLKVVGMRAKFVYFAHDRLAAIGMHPVLEKLQWRVAREFDLIRTNANGLVEDFPADAPVEYLPQGLDKASFDVETKSPYSDGTVNIVIAGDMLFDEDAVHVVLEAFPTVEIHAFGRTSPEDLIQYRNFHHYGEVPFSALLPYIKHADVGFAPYRDRPGLDYLAESSLKLIQYSYARLPIVAPDFAKGTRDHVVSYVPAQPATVARAVSRALSFDRSKIEVAAIPDWEEMARLVLTRLWHRRIDTDNL